MKHRKLFCALAAILVLFASGCSSAPEIADLVVDVDESSLAKIPEEEVISFYEENKADLQEFADYLLANKAEFEAAFGTSPIVLTESNYEVLISDKRIKALADELFTGGIITSIHSLNDGSNKNVRFYLAFEPDVYDQSLLYTNDKDIEAKYPAAFGDVTRFRPLGGGWYYSMHHYDGVKYPDRYRKAAWNTLDEKTRSTIKSGWREGVVTWRSWDSVPSKMGDVERVVVVSVRFQTDLDPLLGPLTIYLDPMTCEFIGTNFRY